MDNVRKAAVRTYSNLLGNIVKQVPQEEKRKIFKFASTSFVNKDNANEVPDSLVQFGLYVTNEDETYPVCTFARQAIGKLSQDMQNDVLELLANRKETRGYAFEMMVVGALSSKG